MAARVGGKALALARMSRAGIAVPPFVAVTTDAYEAYLEATGLRVRILFELERKDFAEMRWEELWDAALRIRSLFLTTPLPEELRAALAQPLAARFSEVATVVRSSAPGEDSAGASFAGLHESYVNVRGVDAILEHVKLVWASLWSDAALLYRRELGLDPRRSVMAVVVQEIVAGERSGVAFSCHPDDDRRALVEAVHGLNQGLVDGVVEPDRWTLDRRDGALLEHHQAERLEMMSAAADGVRLIPLPGNRRDAAPLAADEVPLRVRPGAARRGALRGAAGRGVDAAPRRALRAAVAPDHHAGRRGRRRARRLSEPDAQLREPAASCGGASRTRTSRRSWPRPTAWRPRRSRRLDDAGLRAALQERKAAHDRGVDVYIADFIPFAHGARLFGSAYNDVLRPEDPYEFTDLLTATPMLSLRRNAALERLAACLRDGDEAAAERALAEYLAEFGDAGGVGGPGRSGPRRRRRPRPRGGAGRRAPARGAPVRARLGAPRPGGARAALHRGAPEAERSAPPSCSSWAAPAGACATTTICTSAAWSACSRRRWTRRAAAACRSTTICGPARSRCRRRWARRLRWPARPGRLRPPAPARRPPACAARRARSSGSPPGPASPSAAPAWSRAVRISPPSKTARSSSATPSRRR